MNWSRLLDPLVLKLVFVSNSECKLWQSHVQAREVLHGGRVHYMRILISRELIGFLNVYAPNSTIGRIRLWNMLLHDLLVA